MTRVKYSNTSPFGSPFNSLVYQLVGIQSQLTRIKKVADSLTGGGVTLANLEGSAEFNVSVGQGATFYADLQNIIAGVNAITCLPDLDPGN